jgi:hypothetical protein
MTDAFDRFWQWANKPRDSQETIPAVASRGDVIADGRLA